MIKQELALYKPPALKKPPRPEMHIAKAFWRFLNAGAFASAVFPKGWTLTCGARWHCYNLKKLQISKRLDMKSTSIHEIAKTLETKHLNNFKLGSVLSSASSNTPSKAERDQKNSCQENKRKNRQTKNTRIRYWNIFCYFYAFCCLQFNVLIGSQSCVVLAQPVSLKVSNTQ